MKYLLEAPILPPCRVCHTDLISMTWGCRKNLNGPSCSSRNASVIQLWQGFSEDTQVLRTIRPWVIITLAFTPKFPVYFTPQVLPSVSFSGPLGFCFLTSFRVIAHASHCRPCHGHSCLCFSEVSPAIITAAFSGIFQVVERVLFLWL